MSNPYNRPFSIPTEVYYIINSREDKQEGGDKDGDLIEGTIVDAFYQYKDQPRGRREGWRCMVRVTCKNGERIIREKYFKDLNIL